MIPTDGRLLIDKPPGITSFGVVARVRRILREETGRKLKVGHTGTLDPFATGLMLIVTGSYCKRAQEFSKLDKTYEVVAHLGQTSTTGDPEGEITLVSDHIPTLEQIQSTLQLFRGQIVQTPPVYSAIKINGQRAYHLARAGQAIEMPTRIVTISRLDLINYTYPDVELICDVSSGTYIRALVEAIGKNLGVGAYTTALRRTRVGKYSIADSLTLDALEGRAQA